MVEIELDGQKVEVAEGSMVMHAAEKAGTYIPHFCYHKKLSIAANCRMCLVDVEKAPKPVPACATPVTQGMIVRTTSEKAIKAQKSVMEFLLINHPLDCPICDQGGECQLQDLAVGYGGSASRYQEEKRVVFHKDVGPLISMEEMSRCIHCTRCVRFGQEIAGVMELGMIHRGEHSEITTVSGSTVDSELSGNMIDICPVGALTSKPFRYSARTSGAFAPQVHQPARFHRGKPDRAGQKPQGHARRTLRERRGQRMLDCGPGPFFLRGTQQRRALDPAHAQTGGRLERGQLADCARIRGKWPARHQEKTKAPRA